MVRAATLIAAFLLAPAACAAANAQENSRDQSDDSDVFERGCGDDQGNDRCSNEVQRRMRELYGISDAETLSAQGVILRRTMIVDGYGRDVVAITFSRKPGRPPTVDIATPRANTGPESQLLTAILNQDIWSRVLEASRDFDQQLVRELPANRNPLEYLCLHSWFVVVEAVDPPRLNQSVLGQHEDPAEIRRDAEDTCGDGLATRYAFELARIARELLPECSSLRVADSRNDAALLSLCHRLRGDRIAAGDAYHFLEKLRRSAIPRLPDPDELEMDYFAASAEQHIKPFSDALKGGRFSFDAPEATDLDHASVEGQVLFTSGEDREIADLKLNLVRQIGDFVILSYELSNRRPYR